MTSPTSKILEGDWYIRHSSRSIWRDGKVRNVQTTTVTRPPHGDRLLYSWKNAKHEVEEMEVDSSDEPKVLGRGKVGRLESWMKETEYGIEDSAGEIRADWRAHWIMLGFGAEGCDLLCNRPDEVPEADLKDILTTLNIPEMFSVPQESTRHEEMRLKMEKKRREWEQITGAKS